MSKGDFGLQRRTKNSIFFVPLFILVEDKIGSKNKLYRYSFVAVLSQFVSLS
jgi:hypothetical protein